MPFSEITPRALDRDNFDFVPDSYWRNQLVTILNQEFPEDVHKGWGPGVIIKSGSHIKIQLHRGPALEIDDGAISGRTQENEPIESGRLENVAHETLHDFGFVVIGACCE